LTKAIPLLLAALGCTQPKLREFAMPRDIEDLRARLLVYIPEGRDIAGARQWMAEHGFRCDPPLPSATEARVHVCRATVADAGWSAWSIFLFERQGRLADVQARP
jgi:hypothetical protein